MHRSFSGASLLRPERRTVHFTGYNADQPHRALAGVRRSKRSEPETVPAEGSRWSRSGVSGHDRSVWPRQSLSFEWAMGRFSRPIVDAPVADSVGRVGGWRVWKIGDPISVRHSDSSLVSWAPTRESRDRSIHGQRAG